MSYLKIVWRLQQSTVSSRPRKERDCSQRYTNAGWNYNWLYGFYATNRLYVIPNVLQIPHYEPCCTLCAGICLICNRGVATAAQLKIWSILQCRWGECVYGERCVFANCTRKWPFLWLWFFFFFYSFFCLTVFVYIETRAEDNERRGKESHSERALCMPFFVFWFAQDTPILTRLKLFVFFFFSQINVYRYGWMCLCRMRRLEKSIEQKWI